MDTGLLIVLTCIAVIGFGLAYFYVRDAVHGLYAHYIERPRAEREVSALLAEYQLEITSSDRPSEPSAASVLRTDGEIAPAPPVVLTPTRAQIIDSCKLMREYGLSREQARAIVRVYGGALPNDLWTQVAPADEAVVTPIAGRSTKAVFRYDDPELEYVEPQT